jgi:hypothetical protein
MKTRMPMFAAMALSAAAGVASASSASDHPIRLAEAVQQLESRYPGDVVAIELDASGDKREHYHVQMRFPASGTVNVDVDAWTLEMASRDVAPLPVGGAALPEVVALIASQLPGEITRAQFDSASGAPPHFDVDVRLRTGDIARTRIDPISREISWRTPAVVASD